MQLEQNLRYLTIKRGRFISTHVILPGLILGLLFAGLEWSGSDVWLGAHFYQANIKQWPYKDHWFMQNILHKGGKYFFYFLLACILVLIGRSYSVKSVPQVQRQGLIYLLLASLAGPLLIIWLKNQTHIYCPWELQIFGGAKPYIRFFDTVTDSLPIGHCFPAAHAGSGFTFMSLYFCFWLINPHYRYHGLFFGLSLGILYGVTQQIRGAHFLSHDVMSALLCWYVSLIFFILFFARRVRWT